MGPPVREEPCWVRGGPLHGSAGGMAHRAQFDLQAELLQDVEEVQHEAIAGDFARVHLREKEGEGLTPSERRGGGGAHSF